MKKDSGFGICEFVVLIGLLSILALSCLSFQRSLTQCRKVAFFSKQVLGLLERANAQASLGALGLTLLKKRGGLVLQQSEHELRRVEIPQELSFSLSPPVLRFHANGVSQPARTKLQYQNCTCEQSISLRGRIQQSCSGVSP
jgi:hypothetical protein